MHRAFDAHGGLWEFLTDWCVFVFFVWPRLRQQYVSVAPICDSAPSGCTMALHCSFTLVKVLSGGLFWQIPLTELIGFSCSTSTPANSAV
jgi:hypothetical protein